ncbi:sensor histidine kinase [Lederbergia ruris]|uniref:HAMP domain-containing sensor histidine kinase n=1 Tax=Lederbergia ruris TaxID=217495 RepID=UPI00130E133D
MKVKRLIVLNLLVFSVGMMLSVMIIHNKNSSEVDLVAMNELVKTIEKNWGKEESFNKLDFKQSFSVVDPSGKLVYQTSGSHYINLYESIKHRETIIDIWQNNEMVGKLIIPNKDHEILQQIKKELIIAISLIFSFLMVTSIIYIVYIDRTLLKPFQHLKDFAANVARGNLDIPLNMTQNNYFGAFTESFDLMREELSLARQREYESNRSKKELVATLSHDIKTPIASIKAVSELLLIQAKDEKVTKQVNTIYSKAEQIDLLVTDMFHATLEELQQLKLTVTEESSEILIDMIENVNYDQQIIHDPIPECMILMDPVRMQQVIDNIISNSYKYAGTRITVHSQINQGYLELHILDFGPGISAEELPLLFNKYYRGKNVEGENGSGLGLFISKYFMENMKGEISCSNRNDGFTVVLKIKLA